MKHIKLGIASLAVVLATVALADRTDIWNANSVAVYQVELIKLSDGGCAVQAYATITKQDGGITSEGSAVTPVAGANRVTCLDIMDVKAPVLFKADKSL